MHEFAYTAEAVTEDGQSHPLDLEEHGWADKELLARTVTFSIVPKDRTSGLPIVMVNIPSGGKPVFKSRIFGRVINESGEPLFRCYAVGFHLLGRSYWTWVLPTGDIEVGDDPTLADLLLANL